MATVTNIITGKIHKVAYTAANAIANPPADIKTAINTILLAQGWTSWEAPATGHTNGVVYKQTDPDTVDKYALIDFVRIGSHNQINISVYLDWVLGVGPTDPVIASTVHSVALGTAAWALYVYGKFPSARADIVIFN
jgi:hypothetical protein